MSKVTQAREELKSRLLSVDGIDAVLNPVEQRDRANHPESGCYSVLWSLPREQTMGSGAVIWRCTYGVDTVMPWVDGDDMEAKIDALSLGIARAVNEKWDAMLVREFEVTSVSAAYPEGGYKHAAISFEITLRVVDSQS